MASEELTWTEPGDEPGASATRQVQRDGDHALRSGARLGRYVVLSRMGSGGMGVVYAAYDPDLDRRVAVKLMHQQHGAQASDTEAERAARRLLGEAKAMAQLNHPNVIAVHDVGTIDDRVFIAMEFVEGVPLTDWVAEGHDLDTTLAMFTKAGRGLEAAHRAGLVHRDFKPDNVLVGNDGRVRVLDFGLARRFDVADDLRARRTNTREAGTPAYMAPEQHTGSELDHRADQFAFCVALYEALYGEAPFAGRTRIELAIAVTDGEVRPAPKGAEVPTWIRAALLRGLARDPKARWPSMGALLHALTQDPYRRFRKLGLWAVAGLATFLLSVAVVQAGMTPGAPGPGRMTAADLDVAEAVEVEPDPEHEAVLALIEDARVRSSSGDLTTAGSRVETAVARARELDEPRLLAEALLVQGRLGLASGELEGAAVALEEAALASERAGADGVRAQIAVALTHAYARTGRIERARVQAASARAILDRVDADALARAELSLALAYADLAADDPGRAEATAAAAVEQLERVFSADETPRQLTALREVRGVALHRMGDREGAHRELSEALAWHEDHGGHPAATGLQVELADTMLALGWTDEAAEIRGRSLAR